MKVCTRCLTNKHLNAFNRDTRYRLGVTGWCIECKNKRSRERAQEIKKERKTAIWTKLCRACKLTKAATDFSRCASKKDGLSSRCKECRKSLEAYQRVTSDAHKRGHLWFNYRMTIDDMKRLLDEQEHTCAICMRDIAKPTIDHDHATGAVRGLLCYRCNTMLRGIEDATFVRQALEYVAHHKAIGSPLFSITDAAAATRNRTKREASEMRSL